MRHKYLQILTYSLIISNHRTSLNYQRLGLFICSFSALRYTQHVIIHPLRLSFQCSSVGMPLGMRSRAGAWERGGETERLPTHGIFYRENFMVTIIDKASISQTSPISLKFHLDTTLNISADEARHRVNRQVVANLGTGTIAREPELIIAGEQIAWRVPIALSLPTLGDLGKVGEIEVDARTGDILTQAQAQEKIIKHASLLYNGATLQTK